MESSVIAGWTDFFIAAAGALGALVGLVFVSLSINLARIIELPGLAGRAGETMILLTGTLVGILVSLMPHLSAMHLGLTLSVVTLTTWIAPTVIQFRTIKSRAYYRLSHEITRALLHQSATLPGLLSALALCGLFPGGIAWFAMGVIMAIIVAVMNAWVLLVEILR
jgi:modulator of FtsH protease